MLSKSTFLLCFGKVSHFENQFHLISSDQRFISTDITIYLPTSFLLKNFYGIIVMVSMILQICEIRNASN